MRVEAVAEVLVRAGAVALAHGTRGVEEGPAGQADAEGDEGFFFEAAGELLPAVFVKEIAGMVVSWGLACGEHSWGDLPVPVERGGERCVGHFGLELEVR